MVFRVNHATRKGTVDEVGERLLRPFRLREGIRVACDLEKVRIDTFLFATCGLSPQRLRLFTSRNVALVPGIVQVPGRDLTEEKNIVRLGR